MEWVCPQPASASTVGADGTAPDPGCGVVSVMRLNELFVLAHRLGDGTHGVVSAAELRLAGADPDTVKAAVHRHWNRSLRGIYVPHRDPLTPAELGHVAVKHAGPGAVLTGLLAARAVGLRWVPDVPGAMVLVAGEVRRRGSEGVVLVRRCAGLDQLETTLWEGLHVAPVAQVVVDSAHQVLAWRRTELLDAPARYRSAWLEERCLRDVRGLLLGAVTDGRCTTEAVLAVLDAGAVAGTALTRRACRDAQAGAVSPPEAELVDGLLSYGVPFFCNVEVWRGDVLLGVLDVWLEGTGVGGEMDSKAFHAEADLLDATLLRHSGLSRAGLELCHITPKRYRADPSAFHRTLFGAVSERRQRGLGDPQDLRFVPRGPRLQGPKGVLPPYRRVA